LAQACDYQASLSQVALGGVCCARCGLPIDPGEPFDLGHDDHDRSRYSAPSIALAVGPRPEDAGSPASGEPPARDGRHQASTPRRELPERVLRRWENAVFG
jgi:hypothetical protein